MIMDTQEWIESEIAHNDGSGESCGTSTIIGTGYGSGAHCISTGHGYGHGQTMAVHEADGYGCGFAGGKWPDSR